MMHKNPTTGFVTFSCNACIELAETCANCAHESSTYMVGYHAGESGLPSCVGEFRDDLKEIYTAGYEYGLHKPIIVGRFPVYVNISKLDDKQAEELLDLAIEQTGAQLFRDKTVFFSVLKDRREAAKDTYKFLTGPYLALIPLPNGVIRVNTADKVEYGSVYLYEDFLRRPKEVFLKDQQQ